jgi:hypothetical protein
MARSYGECVAGMARSYGECVAGMARSCGGMCRGHGPLLREMVWARAMRATAALQ